MVLNAAVSYGAFWVLYHWGGSAASDASGETDPLHLLGLSAGAGFGGAALIRARLATVRLPSGQEFGFGPVIVIETLLSVVDRQLDRQLAAERYHTVHKLMKGIDFDRAKERLPKELLLAMQSVPEVEAAQLARPVDEMDRMDDLSSQTSHTCSGTTCSTWWARIFSPRSSKTRCAARNTGSPRRPG